MTKSVLSQRINSSVRLPPSYLGALSPVYSRLNCSIKPSQSLKFNATKHISFAFVSLTHDSLLFQLRDHEDVLESGTYRASNLQ